MNIFFIVFSKYKLEILFDLEDECRAYEDYFFHKLKNNNAPAPYSRVHYSLLFMKNYEHKNMEAWVYKTDMSSDDVWDMFDTDYNQSVSIVREDGVRYIEDGEIL